MVRDRVRVRVGVRVSVSVGIRVRARIRRMLNFVQGSNPVTVCCDVGTARAGSGLASELRLR